MRQKFSSTFALFRDNIQFPFLQRSDVNRAYCSLQTASAEPKYRAWCGEQATGWTTSLPDRFEIFLFFRTSGPALGSIQPAIQWVLGVLSSGAKPPGSLQLITRLHLLPRLRIKGSIPLLPPYALTLWTGTNLNLLYCFGWDVVLICRFSAISLSFKNRASYM